MNAVFGKITSKAQTTVLQAGLQATWILRAKLFTLDNRLISRKIGQLSRRDRASARKMRKDPIAL